MMINCSVTGKNYIFLVCSKPRLVAENYSPLTYRPPKRPLKFRMIHNLFCILPLFEILLYSLVLLKYILSFSFLSVMCFVHSMFLNPLIRLIYSLLIVLMNSLPLVYIQINSITEIRIACLNIRHRASYI
jgi:hypothetical protein